VLIVLVGQIIEAKMARLPLSKVSCAMLMILKKIENWNVFVPKAFRIQEEY